MANEYMLALERDILITVQWELTVPTAHNWLNIYTADLDN